MVLNALSKKEKPWVVLDTHAGAGLYRLASEEARKQKEYETGVSQLFNLDSATMPPEIKQYLSIIKLFNAENSLTIYPGSPMFSRELMRTGDKGVFCEIQEKVCSELKQNFLRDKQVAVHPTDGYQAMKAFLPPKENRGLVLIDPPFESQNEFDQIKKALDTALKRWRSGCYMIWYPVKNKFLVSRFKEHIKKLNLSYLILNFKLSALQETKKLSECELLLINPPWKLDEKLKGSVLPYLEKAMNIKTTIMSNL